MDDESCDRRKYSRPGWNKGLMPSPFCSQVEKSSAKRPSAASETAWLSFVLLPMKHMVIVYGNLRRQGQTTGFAN